MGNIVPVMSPAPGERLLRFVGDRVRFTGPLIDDGLDRAYADADVLVLASRTETYGMVVTEALARGLLPGPEAMSHRLRDHRDRACSGAIETIQQASFD